MPRYVNVMMTIAFWLTRARFVFALRETYILGIDPKEARDQLGTAKGIDYVARIRAELVSRGVTTRIDLSDLNEA